MDRQHEVEGTVYWSLEYQGRNIIITVGTNDGKPAKVIVYTCQYNPICGYDRYDIANVDKILDEWITKFKG